jgi:hypothetical protein
VGVMVVESKRLPGGQVCTGKEDQRASMYGLYCTACIIRYAVRNHGCTRQYQVGETSQIGYPRRFRVKEVKLSEKRGLPQDDEGS